jgi:fido (protein-threonine AMPylation protein)
MPEQTKLFFWNNQNLFSNNYLEHHLPTISLWEEQRKKINDVFEAIKKSYEIIKALKLGPGQEAELEDKFIRPVLNTLGYEFSVQPFTQRGYKKKRPDYALFKDSHSLKTASKDRANPKKFFSQALTILESKYWNRRLNDSDKNDILDSRDPTAQTVKYLEDVHLHTDGKISWAILTNGKHWRLFYYKAASRSGNFFEIDLEEIITRDDAGKFLYFYLFFSRNAFIPDSVTGRTWLDQHLRGTEDYATRVSTKLKDLIFDKVFEGLAEGFVHYRISELSITKETEESRKDIFKGCLTLLYRLLFLLYAESRNLLPVEEDNYGKVSLSKLKKDIYKDLSATGLDKMSKRSYVYWARLESLFDIIANGDPALNIPIYNGGLFETPKDSFLSIHKLPNPFLAEAIELLTVDHEGESMPDTIPFIDYSSLNVRHLGDIYEGLLEFHVQIVDEEMVEVKEKGKSIWKRASEVKAETKTYRRKEKGEVYIENSKHERKATGSYYTPHYIVDYIVKNTVGLVLDEKLKAAADSLFEREEASKALRKQRSTSSIQGYRAKVKEIEDKIFDTIFGIKVLDPAMGSGHFLVHTVDFISDKIISFLAGYPENPVIRKIHELREEILSAINRQGVRIDESKLTEVNLIKRMVMKRCIYGVDLNDMAVELAKLSLWLDSFTLGAPLSFLDHHLKCGNSLIGTNIEELEKALTGYLFAINLEPLRRAIRDMIFVSDLPDATVEQVRESYKKFGEANKGLKGYRILLDMLVAEHFGVSDAKKMLVSDFDKIDLNNFHASISKLPDKDRKLIERAESITKEKKFFHWEIEFPEVFYEKTAAFGQKIDKKTNPGFDCVIGNPPYGVSFEKNQKDFLNENYISAEYQLESFTLFIEKAASLAKTNGFQSFITPTTWLSMHYYENLRSFLLSDYWLKEIIFFKEPVFEDATVETCIEIVQKSKTDGKSIIKIGIVSGLPEHLSANWNTFEQRRIKNFEGKRITEYITSKLLDLFERLKKDSLPLRDIALMVVGCKPYQVGKGNPPQTKKTVENRIYDANFRKDNTYKQYLRGKDFHKYSIVSEEARWISYGEWLAEPRPSAPFFTPKKIVIRQTADTLIATIDDNKYLNLNNVHNLVLKDKGYSLKFILALLNSKFLSFLHRILVPEFGRVFAEVKIVNLEKLPIRNISFSTHEKERKEMVDEAIRLYQTEIEHIAINADKWQNKDEVKENDKGRDKEGSAEARKVARKPRGYKVLKEGVSGQGSRLGGKVHGIREGAGEYEPSEGTPGKGEDSTRPLDSTRYFETAQGIKTYSEVSEMLAVSVAKTIEAIIDRTPEEINITSEWICKLHGDITSLLFPDWAGRFRDVNVAVGMHTPPSYFEVPIHVHRYCDDLAARLSFAARKQDIEMFAETLAFADWCFQWIHPFKDFNGRVGRILLSAVLFKLKLPPTETASVEPEEKERYLKALRDADGGDMSLLTTIWIERLSKAFYEKI